MSDISSEEDDEFYIVIDIGSHTTKMGFSGELQPRIEFSTAVSKRRNIKGINMGSKEYYIGEDACSHGRKSQYPIKNDGTPVNYEQLEMILSHGYDREIRMEPHEANVLFTGLHKMNNNDMKRVYEIFLEKLNVPGIQIADSAVLAFLTSKKFVFITNYSKHFFHRENGLVVECGASVTKIVPIVNYRPIVDSVMFFEKPEYYEKRISGTLIDEFLFQLLQKNDRISLNERRLVRRIKEQYSSFLLDKTRIDRVVNNINPGREKTDKFEHLLYRRTNWITIGDERYLAPEIIFRPYLIDQPNLPGLHELVNSCVASCPLEMRKEMYQHIVLSGGTTVMENFEERLVKEIIDSVHRKDIIPKVLETGGGNSRKYLPFQGGGMVDVMCKQEWVVGEVGYERLLVKQKYSPYAIVMDEDRTRVDRDEKERIKYLKQSAHFEIKIGKSESVHGFTSFFV